MKDFDFKELIKSPYMYVGAVVGYLACTLMSKKKRY